MNPKEKLIEILEGTDLLRTLTENNMKRLADFLIEQGIVIPPCKIGTTLYDMSGKQCNVEAFNIEDRNNTMLVSFECDNNCENCGFDSWHQDPSGEYSCDGEWGCASLPFEDFGKVVFLSHEEAEKALQRNS